eukprot:TRINITY_DN16678_c0_g1_i1.p1 TRINITY_DN16678_c0_g1~~TRINITY_DN16678_c0_g1_i1.p1  ORF type:complete len:589 (-),score=88.36 TRINITY_DN16678_c0_g1_i1:40-1578(-)
MSGIVGFFSRAFDAIPVARPQDTAQTGTGTISIENGSVVVRGKGTKFTQEFVVGKHSITPKGEDPLRIKEIKSDEEIILGYPVCKDFVDHPFKIFEVLDQSSMYSNVWDKLGSNGCIGIFPEGGSHDRSELLPLKAGVTLMALGAMERFGKPVYIVPCGLNYFHGHRFRGNCLVEFGRYYKIPMSMVKLYKENRRQACTQLLKIIKESMETVIVHAPDYRTLQEVRLARKLYQGDVVLTPEKYIELHHRFLEGWQKFGDHPEVKQARTELQEYLEDLNALGLRDKHIEVEASHDSGTYTKILIFLRSCLVVLTLGLALPGSILNLPIGICARLSASKHAAEALKRSDVKITGKDVIASKKVVVALKLTLPLYILYTIIVAYYWGGLYAIVFFTFLPLLSFFTIRFAEEGLALASSLHTIAKMRWMYEEKIVELQGKREHLRNSLIKCVTSFGQALAGNANVDDWRIIKQEQVDVPLSPNTLHLRAKKRKAFNVQEQPIISDQEWSELKDIFG